MRIRLAEIIACSAWVAMGAIAAAAQESEVERSTSSSAPFGIITTTAGDGLSGYFGDNGLSVDSQLDYPNAVAVDSAGNIYIADTDNNRIRKVVVSTGIITTIAGSSEAGYEGDSGPAIRALFDCPEGVAVDSKSNVFVADTCNHVVRKIDAASGLVTTVAGHPYMTEFNRACQSGGDDGPATKAELCYPTALAVDSAGNLYIADTNNGLIRKVAADGGAITTVAGARTNGVYGAAAGGSPATQVELNYPRGVALDAEKNLYIANTGFCLIEKVNAVTGILTIYAGEFSQFDGTICTAASEGVEATSSAMGPPYGLAFDRAGNLFFADKGNDLVRRIEAKTSIVVTVAGDLTPTAVYPSGAGYQGVIGYTGDQGSALVAELNDPIAVAVDKSENLYIVDNGNHAIRKVTQTLAATAPRPTMSPSATGFGYGFAHGVQVALSDTASGAKIYYTTDGATPTTASTLYTGPITVSKTASVIAFATAPSLTDSYAVQGNYFEMPAPVISPRGGSFSKPETVTITLSGYGNILYTTDGSNPCGSNTSLYYYSPIVIGKPLTLRAVAAVGSGCGSGASANFVIPTAPVVNTEIATKVTATTATLTGTINPGGLATQYWFLYSPNCGSTERRSPILTMPAGTAAHEVSINITGLEKSTYYCFEISGMNRIQKVQGETQGFTTAN